VNAYEGSKSYQWKSSDWRLLSNEMSPTFTFNASLERDSTHLVYLIAKSLNGCIDTIVNNVIVRSANKAAFSAIPTKGCAPLLVQFTNSSSSKINGYQWDFNDGSDCSIVENPSHIFIDPNGLDKKYKVSLVAFNQYGCTDTAFHEIQLLPTPQVDFVALPIMQTYPERTVSLTNHTPLGNWIYSWNLGDQKPLLTGLLPDYTYELPGEYVISLTAKGAECENTKRVKVIINPGTPLASFEPDTSGCAPLKVKFRNNSQNGSRYEWDFGNGTQSVDFSPSTIYYDEGTFSVKLKVFNQFGVIDETERKIVLHPVPKALFNPLPYRVKIPAQSVTFFNNSENAREFLWDFGDGESSFDDQPIHRYTTTGVFDVTLYITSAEGCKDTFLLAKAVDAFSDGLKVPNAFMPDKSGPNDGYYVSGDPRNHIFYPAVATGDLIEYEMMIYNRWGNLLFVSKEAEQGWNGYYNGVLCPQDVYVWKIRCHFKSGSIVTKTGDVTLIQ
jgi:gliding motility-associated-like protein